MRSTYYLCDFFLLCVHRPDVVGDRKVLTNELGIR